MVPIEEKLQALSKLATKLNEKTDELNDIIDGLNTRLGAANLGVSVWLEEEWHELLVSARSSVEYEEHVTGERRTCWLLGYAKVDNQWQLAARYVNVVENKVDEEVDFYDLQGHMPLSRAPRQVRVEASAHFEDLVEALMKRVESFVRSIDEAKELAEA